jgi:proline racemase
MKRPIEPTTSLTIETPAGLVEVEVEFKDGRIGSASFINVESCLRHDRVDVDLPELGSVNVSIAYGGDFYCFVDADALGLELKAYTEPQMVAAAKAILPAVNAKLPIRHPKPPDIM